MRRPPPRSVSPGGLVCPSHWESHDEGTTKQTHTRPPSAQDTPSLLNAPGPLLPWPMLVLVPTNAALWVSISELLAAQLELTECEVYQPPHLSSLGSA